MNHKPWCGANAASPDVSSDPLCCGNDLRNAANRPPEPEPCGWTVAYRKSKHANHFKRLPLQMTWQEAVDLSVVILHLYPELSSVWYVPTRQAELTDSVCKEDKGNVLAESGKRIRMIDTDDLSVMPDQSFIVIDHARNEHVARYGSSAGYTSTVLPDDAALLSWQAVNPEEIITRLARILSINDMITALDAAPDLSDGIDPRTCREVYDCGLITAADITRYYSYRQMPPVVPSCLEK